MDYIIILDEILKTISKNNYKNVSEIKRIIESNNEILKPIDDTIVEPALIKLHKDGYLDRISIESKGVFSKEKFYYNYKKSFEGIVFISTGGYVNQYSKIREKENELSDLKLQQYRHSSHLVYLTWVIAIGTVIASVYYILEILERLCD